MGRDIERRKEGKRGRRRGDQGIRACDAPPHLSSGSSGCRVRIVYTEPEFQMRNPQAPREFSYSQDCPEAMSLDEAVRQVVSYFHFCAENSSVGWRRVIKSVTVEPR